MEDGFGERLNVMRANLIVIDRPNHFVDYNKSKTVTVMPKGEGGAFLN